MSLPNKKNPGAFLIKEVFFDSTIIKKINENIDKIGWKDPTIPEGEYANEKWRVIKLIENGKATPLLDKFPEIKEMLSFFKTPVIEMVFYAMLPGGGLHKHRDLSGTLELGRMRFHVPVVTHPEITFHLAGEDFHMKTGDLWAINTSYLHAVNNPTPDVTRIHFMMEVEVNDWVWSQLPIRKGFHYYGHLVFFLIFIVGAKALKTISEPSKLQGRLQLIPILLWRLFKKK